MAIIDIKDNPCNKSDIFRLLRQLTDAPDISPERYDYIVSSLNDNHRIFTFVEDDKTVGMVTMLIEQKLIHGGKCVAHIEDLVVDANHRRKGISKALIDHVVKYVESANCYKIILNCDVELVGVYEKSQFEQKGVQMAYYTPEKPAVAASVPGMGWGHKDCGCKACLGDAYFIM